MELEKSLFWTIAVIMDSGKNHQWILKPVSERVLRKLQVPLHKLLIKYKKNNNFSMDKFGEHRRNQESKSTSLLWGQTDIIYPPMWCTQDDTKSRMSFFCPDDITSTLSGEIWEKWEVATK